jgi:HlyD family secretion protein
MLAACARSPAPESSPRPAPAPAVNAALACLGRVEPENGLIRLHARSISGQPSLLAQTTVKEGDPVKAGQVVAVLNAREELETVKRQAEARVRVARDRLAQVKAGAKPGDLAAARAEIARIDAELAHAESEYRRDEKLRDIGVITQPRLDAKKLQVKTLTQSLTQARERLNSLSEVRQVDVEVAQSELESATRDVERAQEEVKQTIIRSPIDGQVVKIHAWPGEEVGPEGIMEVARTGRMYVIAEVPEDELRRVQVGQRATITAASMPAKIDGTVDRIGMSVRKNQLLHPDPAAYTDSRVVEVRIRVDGEGKLPSLIGAEVTVLIHTQAPLR